MHHNSKYAVPDFTLAEIIRIHYGYEMKAAPSNSFKCQCPLHTHTPQGEKALRVWEPPGEHTPEHGGFVCPRGVSGNAWQFLNEALSLPLPGDPGFDETLLFVYDVIGEEPQLRGDYTISDRDRALALLRDMRDSLTLIDLPENNPHYWFDEQDKQWVYRGVAPIVWQEYGVGQLTKNSLRELKNRHGDEAFKAAGITKWKNCGYEWLTHGVVVMLPFETGYPVGVAVRRYNERGSTSIKYAKNSSSSVVMDTSSYIYGLNSLVRSRKPHCYVVEGEFDALALKTRGIPNVIARGGGTPSSLQIDHMYDLGYYYIFVADTDDNMAGFQSIAESAREFPEAEFLLLPGNETDPDSFVQDHGVDAFLDLPTETALAIEMMAEDAYDPEHDWWGQQQEALTQKYMDIILANPTSHDEQNVDTVAYFAGKDVEYLRSWLFYERNKTSIPDRPVDMH